MTGSFLWSSRSLIAGALLAQAVGVALGHAGGGSSHMVAAFLVCAATMVLLATRVLPEYLAALTFFLACAVGGVAPPSVFLTGFTGSAVWLVISGGILGASLRHVGLARRLGSSLLGRSSEPFSLSLVRVAIFGVILLFLMPSAMGRILLLIPILEAVIEDAGLRPGDRRATGILLAGLFGTFFPAMAVLPANVPNNVLIGLLETAGFGVPSFSTYLLLHFPVLGLGKLALLIGLLTVMFRGEAPLPGRPEARARPALSVAETLLSGLLALTILLWLTDAWHGVSAAWVGMGAAVVCLWPGLGLMSSPASKAVGVEPVFYVAGVVGVGAVVDHSGLGQYLADGIGLLIAHVGTDANATFLVLIALAAILGLLVTVVAVPAVLTPIAQGLANATGLSAEAVAMSQVVGFSTVLFPYQAPPLAVALQTVGFLGRDMVRLCLWLAGLTVLLLWPLDLTWWHWLGWLP